MKLYSAASTPIRRHVKIKAEAQPYDMAWELYFEERKIQKVQGRPGLIWTGQETLAGPEGKVSDLSRRLHDGNGVAYAPRYPEASWWKRHPVKPSAFAS